MSLMCANTDVYPRYQDVAMNEQSEVLVQVVLMLESEAITPTHIHTHYLLSDSPKCYDMN